VYHSFLMRCALSRRQVGATFAADLSDFTPIFKCAGRGDPASYVLAYYPEVRDGNFHELRVQTNRAGGSTAC
jgi:hypothetical protein